MTDREQRAQQVGLFRYSLVRPLVEPGLSRAQRGAAARAVASEDHVGPFGEWVRVSRNTLDRWARAYRSGGYEALVPTPRRTDARTPAELLQLAEALRVEEPARTGAQIARLITEAKGHSPSARTLQRHLRRAGLPWKGAQAPRAFGRFEASCPNELWVGDALHGPVVAGHKVYLFAFIDDFSRAFTGYRWGYLEDTLRLEAALRSGIAARGLPLRIYLDNGSAMVSHQLLRACAVLGMQLVHSRPWRPQGRGKIERAFRTVNDQFVVELAHSEIDSLEKLNSLFSAWVESVYHRQVHSETGVAPLERFLSTGAPVPVDPALLRDAFLWSEKRKVNKVAGCSLFGNEYEVDPALVGQQIELVFSPFDLTDIEVRFQGRPMGKAVPRRIGRHVHPAARHEPGEEGEKEKKPSGIDYLALVEARRSTELARRIAYRGIGGTEAAQGGEDR